MKDTKNRVNAGHSGKCDDDIQCINLSSDDDSELMQEVLGELNDSEDEQISKELDDIRTDLCNRTGMKKDEDPSTQNRSTNDSQQKPANKNKTSRQIVGSDKTFSSMSSKYTHKDASSANNFAANSENIDEAFIDFFDKDLIDEFAMETSVEVNTFDKIPKTVDKRHTTSSSRNKKITKKTTRDNDENSHADKIGKKPIVKIRLGGLRCEIGKKENLVEKRKVEKPYTKTRTDTVKSPLKESNFIEVAGEDIKDGIYTRVIIIGEYFVSNYKTAWPENCEVKPYLLYKRNVSVDSIYSEIRDHRFLKNSKRILIMFMLGFHDVAKYSDIKAQHCRSNHRKFRILQDLFYHYSDSSKYVSSMVALKNKIEADKTFSAIFCYLPYINFSEGVSKVYSSYQKYGSESCSCFHEIRKAKQDSSLRSFRTHADTNIRIVWKINREIFYKNLNETKEGIFEFLPFDVLFNDNWLSVETCRSSHVMNNSKQLSMMISKYTFGKGGQMEYEASFSQKSFMESKLEGMSPVRVLIIGDTWMKDLAEKWPSKDQIQPFFYCKDDMTLNDIKKIIFSLDYNEELLVMTAVPSGELFSITQYSHCKNHTPLQYPVLQKDLLEEPKIFADSISKKIDLFQLNIKQHNKKCHVVFLTCYPAVFNTCYKQLFEQHIASYSSHNRYDDPFKMMSSSFLDDKLEKCLKQLNIYLEYSNNWKNCKSFDVFSLVSRLRLLFPKLFVFPTYYQHNHPPEVIEKLFGCVNKYIYSVYELMASKKLKLPSAKITTSSKRHRKHEDEERPESNSSSKKQNSLTEYLYLYQSNVDNQKADVKNFGSEAANFPNINNHNQNEAPCPEVLQESLVAYPQHLYESSVSLYSGQQQQQKSYQQEPSYMNQMSQENIAVYPQAFYNTGVAPISGQQYFQQTPAYANSFTYDNTSSTTFIPSNSQMESYANISTYNDQGSSTFVSASTSFTSNNQKSITEQLREELYGATNVGAHTEVKNEVTMQSSQDLSYNTEKLDPSIVNREKKQNKSRSKERSKSRCRDEKRNKSRSKERRRSRSRSRSKGRRRSKSTSRSKGRKRSKSRSRSRRKERRRTKSRSKDRRRGKSRSRSKERRRKSRSKERRRSKSGSTSRNSDSHRKPRHRSKDESKSKSKRHSSKQDNHTSKRSKRSGSKDAILKDCTSEKERTAISKLWNKHVKECDMYSENPETHPDHDRMKQMFMHVIRSQGLMSPEASNDHWKECWKKKMTSLLKESWEEKKKKCLSDLSSKSKRKAVSRSRSSSTSSSSASSTSSSSSSSSYSDSEKRRKLRHKNRQKNVKTKAKYKSKTSLDKETALKNISPLTENINSLNSTYITAENGTSQQAGLPQASMSHPVLSEEKSYEDHEESLSVSSLEQGSELLLTSFSILCQISERLGALGLSLKHLNEKALELAQKGINPYDCIDEDSEMLLSLIHTKLKENLKDLNLSFIQRSIIQEAESRLKAIITYIETRKNSSPVDIEALAKLTFGMQVADVIEFIRTKLKKRGRGDISNNELMIIYLQVKSQQVQLVTKKASSDTTAINIKK